MKATTIIFWIYAALVLFEGALRKWFLPILSEQLLIVRDPLVLLIFGALILQSRLRFDGWWFCTLALALISLFVAAFGHANPIVAAYGLRTNYLHLLLIVAAPTFLFRDDVVKIGRFLLWVSIPMTALLILQFLSPRGAWINIGPGGEGSASFDGAAGFYRSSGTFSFTTGLAQFYTLVSAFVFAGYSPLTRQPKWLLVACSICIMLAIPMSISRLLLISVVIVLLSFLTGSFWNIRNARSLVPLGTVALLALAILPLLPGSNEASTAFNTRWESSTTNRGGVKGAIIDRVTDDLFESKRTSLLGAGLGAGTQVGTKLLRGNRGFAFGESEWGRILGELGVVLGPLFLLLRIALIIWIVIKSIRSAKLGNLLPICLAGMAAPLILMGQWGQSTTLGFAALSGGLALAACNPTREEFIAIVQKQKQLLASSRKPNKALSNPN